MELEQKILAITKVIDNGGKTADRYTVYTPDGSIHYMSLNPNSPNGVNMYGGEFNNKFVDGEKLLFFPNEVQKAIIKNMKDDNSTNGYQKFVDLFQFYNLQPENVQWIIKNYTDMYGEDLNHKEIQRLLRELERIGYTFDYDMSGEMYGLRPIELELNDIQGYEDDEDDDDEYEMGGNVGKEIWEESPQDILNELVQNMSGKNYKNFCYEYNIDNKDANEMIQFIYGLSDEDATEIIFNIEKNYESGGKIKNRSLNTIVRYSDGRKRRLDTWNRGRSWTMDRKSFNKNEDWEIPMNERKSKNTIKRQRVTRPIEKINSFMSGSPTELPQIKNDINPKLNEIISQNPVNLINNINTESMENKQDIQTNIGDNVGYARGSESEFYEGGGMMKSEKGKYADGGNIFDEYEEMSNKERMDAAISRMKDGISYKWVNTDMGSGWQLKLYFPNTSDVISDRLRVDLFEPYQEEEEWDELSNEDKKYYYNEWKNDFLETELENFIQLNIDNENIDFFMEDDEEYSKGGNVKKRRVKDYKYVPNYMIESVTVAKGKKETEIDGGNILDGLYVKGRVNFEDGGDMEYEKGGSVNRDRKIVKYKDGRKRKLNTWNEGAGYTKDRKSFNKSEDWEIPMNERSGAKSSSRSSAKSSSKYYSKSKSKSTSKSGKGKSYSYIPNAMLREAEIENNGKRTYIDAKDILDGIYVKKGTKYANGGGVDMEVSKEQLENMVGRKLNGWNDDKVEHNGATYQKLFLKPIYKKI